MLSLAAKEFLEDLDAPMVLNGVRPWLISCDESGMHGSRFYGFGSLWMPWDRRGDFVADLRHIATKHRMHFGVVDGIRHEFKWSKVSAQKFDFYRDVVDYFFSARRLSFHCVVVRKDFVDLDLHPGGYPQAQQKHFTMLLTNKIGLSLKHHHRKFRVWVDPLPSAYAKANEVVEIISNHVLNRSFGKLNPVDKVIPRDSHETPSIQLCDLLLGAVMSAWQQDVTAPAKIALQEHIAAHLGWPNLRADTLPHEKKFNIWFFCNPRRRPKDVHARVVVLK